MLSPYVAFTGLFMGNLVDKPKMFIRVKLAYQTNVPMSVIFLASHLERNIVAHVVNDIFLRC